MHKTVDKRWMTRARHSAPLHLLNFFRVLSHSLFVAAATDCDIGDDERGEKAAIPVIVIIVATECKNMIRVFSRKFSGHFFFVVHLSRAELNLHNSSRLIMLGVTGTVISVHRNQIF